MSDYVKDLMAQVKAKNPAEPEFHQAVQEVAESVAVVLDKHPKYREAKILERIIEPERVLMFRVPWLDDKGKVQVNRGFRIEMNSAIGPYKGGLRLHPTVNLGILKFLAFEQVFKNALTTLPMGGGKGGSDFDPKGKSDNEVMKFCQSFMTELQRHIGQFTDVPAGDIGVGGREIGFLFGQYKRIRNEFVGVLTGKGLNWGGRSSVPRRPATAPCTLRLRCSPRAARRSRARPASSAVPATCPVHRREDPRPRGQGRHGQRLGRLHLRRGRHRPRQARLDHGAQERQARPHQRVRRQVQERRLHARRPQGRLQPAVEPQGPCAFPSATQNEINAKDAANLLKNGVYVVSEGANMPTVPEGVDQFLQAKILYGPGKAANAGGVATSGLECRRTACASAGRARKWTLACTAS